MPTGGFVIDIINTINIIIAFILFTITLRTYRSYKLKIFKRAWGVLAFGAFLWVLGHIFMILHAPPYIHYTLFTLFIVFLAIGIFMLSQAAKTLGGV